MSRQTAGTESFQGTMSNKGALSTRFRLSLDFSKWGRMRMPRGGTFDSDSSNNLVFSGSKTQRQAGFSGRDSSLRTQFKDNFNRQVVNDSSCASVYRL